jgi:outer membrane protein assembly factor BamB
MRIALITILAASCASAFAVDAGPEWPRFRGPTGDGFAGQMTINKDWQAKKPKELWRVPMNDKGSAGPSVAGGMVYIVDHAGRQDIVRALKMADGSEVWKYAYDDAEKTNFGFHRATPTVDDGRVYTFSRLGRIVCLDAASGKRLWDLNAMGQFGGSKPQWDYAGSVLVDGDQAVICPGGSNAAVVALDKKTGKVIWQGGGSEGAAYTTPVPLVLNGKRMYVTGTAKGFIGVDAKTGKLGWSFPWETKYNVNAASSLLTEAGIFVTSGYGRGCAMIAVTETSAKQVWTNKIMQSHMTTPVYKDGCIYGTTDPGSMVCLDAKTGNEQWRHKGWGKGGMISVDGCLIVQDDSSGEIGLVALNPSAYKELGRIKAFDRVKDCWTSPIVAEGRMLARNQDSLVCYDLR